jgi:hypothetical protein
LITVRKIAQQSDRSSALRKFVQELVVPVQNPRRAMRFYPVVFGFRRIRDEQGTSYNMDLISSCNEIRLFLDVRDDNSRAMPELSIAKTCYSICSFRLVYRSKIQSGRDLRGS